VQGCDASILIQSTPRNLAELDAGPNLTIHGLDLIDTAKAALEKACPGIVSCADIIALATRDAVVMVGRRRNLYCLINTRSFVQLPVCNVGKLSV
jgi:peroxidase